MIAAAMIAAAVQSTTRQNGGHHRIGDELATVLPQVLDPVGDEPSDEQPRRAGDGGGGDNDERCGDTALGCDDARTAVGNGEANVHRGDQDQTERVNRGRIEPPEREWCESPHEHRSAVKGGDFRSVREFLFIVDTSHWTDAVDTLRPSRYSRSLAECR